jgi:hypothetical protein
MKYLLLSSLILFTCSNLEAQSKFKNPFEHIEMLEFNGDGMALKLTTKGIQYARKGNSRDIAKKVLDLYQKMTNGSSELKLKCIAHQIFIHANAYNLKQPPNAKINRTANPINANYTALIWDLCQSELIPNMIK